MAYPRKEERNKIIVEDRDVRKMPFSKIGEKHNLKRNSAFDIYKREKNRTDKKLSPVA